MMMLFFVSSDFFFIFFPSSNVILLIFIQWEYESLYLVPLSHECIFYVEDILMHL